MTIPAPPYSHYAAIYDEIGQNFIGKALADSTLQLLQHYGHSGRTALDLACGAGAATFSLERAGFQVTGLDISSEMLIAAKLGAPVDSTIHWVRGDIRQQPFNGTFSLATCFYDAVNHLIHDSDLESFLHSTRQSIETGGLLVFDVNTRRRLEEGWGDACFVAVDRPGLFGVYRSWFDPEHDLSPLVLTFFQKTGAVWRRFDEEHLERAYALSDIDAALSAAGFCLLDCLAFDDRTGLLQGTGTEMSYRVVYFAVK